MNYSIEAIQIVWGGSIGIAVVVVIVVAILLTLIKKTALEIDDVAADIWTQGKLVANNTIHIPMFLSTTNAVADEILENAVGVLHGATAVEKHIDGCPGCPECVL